MSEETHEWLAMLFGRCYRSSTEKTANDKVMDAHRQVAIEVMLQARSVLDQPDQPMTPIQIDCLGFALKTIDDPHGWNMVGLSMFNYREETN